MCDHTQLIYYPQRKKYKILTQCILVILLFYGPYVCYMCSVKGGRVVHALLCFCYTSWDWHI